MKNPKNIPNIDHELAAIMARRFLEICLIVSIIGLVLYFGLGNFIAGTPEPEFWLRIEAAELAIWEAIVR